MSQFHFYIPFKDFVLARFQYRSHILGEEWRATPIRIGFTVIKTRFGMKPVLKSKTASIRKMFRSFLAEDHGGVTVEFVLWLPVFAALIAGAGATDDQGVLALHGNTGTTLFLGISDIPVFEIIDLTSVLDPMDLDLTEI